MPSSKSKGSSAHHGRTSLNSIDEEVVGATPNLSSTTTQMLYSKPPTLAERVGRAKTDEFDNLKRKIIAGGKLFEDPDFPADGMRWSARGKKGERIDTTMRRIDGACALIVMLFRSY